MTRYSSPRLGRRMLPARIVSSGLALSACVGVFGVLAVRSTVDANAHAEAQAAAVSSALGDTSAQLVSLQEQVAAQAKALASYQAALARLSAKSSTATRAVLPAPPPVIKKPVVSAVSSRPVSSTKSS